MSEKDTEVISSSCKLCREHLCSGCVGKTKIRILACLLQLLNHSVKVCFNNNVFGEFLSSTFLESSYKLQGTYKFLATYKFTDRGTYTTRNVFCFKSRRIRNYVLLDPSIIFAQKETDFLFSTQKFVELEFLSVFI